LTGKVLKFFRKKFESFITETLAVEFCRIIEYVHYTYENCDDEKYKRC